MPNTPSLALVSSQSVLAEQTPQRQRASSNVLELLTHCPSVGDVQRGLRQKEFRAHLQPKFDLRTGQIGAAEVLARWQHPQRGLLGPASFIPLLTHEQGLDELLFELLEQSLAYQLRLGSQGRLLGLSFNLSLSQLSNSNLVERLSKRLNEHPLPLSTLTFEITEDDPAEASPACVLELERLGGLGVKLSIDDFGTGNSSLWRLCQAPFTEIKLAGEFTRHLDQSRQYRAIVRYTLALANELGMSVVVEGIETIAQHRRLIEMGVQIGQGFLCARPMSIATFENWIDEYQQTHPLL